MIMQQVHIEGQKTIILLLRHPTKIYKVVWQVRQLMPEYPLLGKAVYRILPGTNQNNYSITQQRLSFVTLWRRIITNEEGEELNHKIQNLNYTALLQSIRHSCFDFSPDT